MLICRLSILSALILALSGCKDNQQAPSPNVDPTEDKKTEMQDTSTKTHKKSILCFGNSLTAGYGLDEQQAWPALMQSRLDSLSLPFKVVNAGLSGETTSGGLNRIDWVLRQPVDLFILELGANDMLRGLNVDITKKNLSAILDKVRAKYPDAQLVVAGMLSPSNMGAEYEKAFNRIFSDLSMQYKAVLIPFLLDEVAGIKELNLPDGKHPNVQGQKIVLENVWQAIAPLLE